MITDPLGIVYGILINDLPTTTIVGTKISPVVTPQCIDGTANGSFPNITITVTGATPYNALDSWQNLDLNEVQIEAWAMSYDQALQAANAAREALQNAGHLCASRLTDEFSSEPGTDPGVYRVGYVHQVFTP